MLVVRLLPTFLAALLSGCTLDRSAEVAYLRGDDGTALERLAERAAEATNDRALEESLRGSVALAAGDYRTAREALVTAGRIMGSFPQTGAREIGAFLATESLKHYLGDPYEDIMNALYTAIAFLAKGDEQNARAALKAGILADSASEEEQYQSDVVALYLLEALLALRQGAGDIARIDLAHVQELDSGNAYASADHLKNVNTLIVVDAGEGPRKVNDGNYGEKAVFEEPAYPDRRVALRVDGVPLSPPIAGVDLAFQARTRGGRPMDYILGGKAVLRGASEVAGMVLLSEGSDRGDQRMSALGGALLLFSLLVRAEADTRHWYLLPGGTHLWMGAVPPGLHSLELDFQTASGNPLPDYRQVWHHLPFGEQELNVYYFRSGYHKGYRHRVEAAASEPEAGERSGR